jgi:pimeloyl-ACP methyl ester carboxylesterase
MLRCRQHLGGRRLILVGTSLGGTLAADYALTHPAAVAGLVLIAPQGFSTGVPAVWRPLAEAGVKVWVRVRVRVS